MLELWWVRERLLNPWVQGTTELPVYRIEELLGTKGRNLYDLWLVIQSEIPVRTALVMGCGGAVRNCMNPGKFLLSHGSEITVPFV